MKEGGTVETRTDVLVMGGGIAGLALANQLKDRDPEIQVTVVEKASFPMPETAHKVGESTLPIAAFYLSEVLGLRDHLGESQVQKMGMRFFGPADGNRDIAIRPESGVRRPPPIPSYQLAHGRLENLLCERAVEKGAILIEGARVQSVDFGDPAHDVVLALSDGTSHDVSCRWVVDASGRAAILKHKLGLSEPPPHRGQAAWFRVADRIAVDDWSDNEEWQSRVVAPERWRSTVHLHGPGYWVWLIALPSNVTSIGLVADPEFVPFERMRRFEPLLEWLLEHEPQLAAEVQQREDLIEDFQTRKEYPRNCSQVFSSTDRWCITGDAGIFLDPLYSPGLDFISVANTAAAGLILDDREEHPEMERRGIEADALFRGFATLTFGLYSDQYELLANAEIISAKFTWETMVYFAFGAPLAFIGATIRDPSKLMQNIAPTVGRYGLLMPAFHTFLRDWLALAGEDRKVAMVSAVDEIMDGMQVRLVEASTSESDIIELVEENLAILEATFHELVAGVAGGLGLSAPAAPDWVQDDQALASFRLIELPPRSDGAAPAPTSQGAGLCWSTKDDPDGAINDHQSAWPGLLGDRIVPPPSRVPNALEALAPLRD